MVIHEAYPNSPQYQHLVNNSHVERFNTPIASSFPVLAQRCSLLIDQLVMDEYTSSGGIWTNHISDMIRYQVWLHKCEMIQDPVNQEETYVRCVRTVWRCLVIAYNDITPQ